MNYNRLFFDYLATKGIVDPMQVHEVVYKLYEKGIVEFFAECYRLLEKDFQPAKSNFEFAASSTMSGEPFNNNDIIYRVYKISVLSEFAILYSDVVWVRNPLEKYGYGDASLFDENGPQNFANDICVLMFLRDLILEGIVKIAATTKSFTEEELSAIQNNFPENFEKKLKELEYQLKDIFKENMSFKLIEHEDQLGIEFEAKGIVERTIERKLGFLNWTSTEDEVPKFIEKALKKKSKKISKKDLPKSGLLDYFVHPIINDLSFQNWFNNGFGQNYITDREIDLELVNKLNGTNDSGKSQRITNGLKHALPTITNAKIEDLLSIRKNETDAFVVYRNSVNALLDNGKDLSEKEMIQLVNDIIKPQIDKIQLTLSSTKKSIKAKTTGEVILGSGIISFAMFSGLVSPELATGITTLAGFHNSYKIGKGLWDYKSSESQIRDNNYYFLWKIINSK
jgi:hypothetical protein